MSLLIGLIVGFAGSIAACGLCVITCTEPILHHRPAWTDWPLAMMCLLLNVSGWIVALLCTP